MAQQKKRAMTFVWTCTALAALLALNLAAGEPMETPTQLKVYIAAEGIRLYSIDLATGALTPISVNEESKPTFLAFHPNKKYIYGAGGELSAYAIDEATGKLTYLNAVPPGGGSSCHLTVDPTGKNVLSASYGAGAVSAHRIQDNGHLGEQTAVVQHVGSSVNKDRQEKAHAHSIIVDPKNQHAYAADLGIDQIVIYNFDPEAGSLTPGDPPFATVQPGAGPRHFTFHPNGKFAYVINELDSTVTCFNHDPATGALTEIETVSTLPEGFTETNYPAEVVVSPDGRFLYGSNRGQDAIVVYTIDPEKGTLQFVEHEPTGGNWPRNFCVDPTGQYLLAANERSNNVVVFRINPETGELEKTEHVIEAPSPMCVRFLE